MNVRVLTIIGIIPLLTACVSVLPEPETPKGLYRLGDLQPSVNISRTLIVREPEGGRVFGGKALASEGRDGALRLIRGVEWATPATRMLQLGLLDTIGTDGGGLAIAKGTGAPGDLELSWRVSDFTVSGESARCRLELTLLDGKTRTPVMQRRVETSASSQSDKSTDRANAMVEAARDCVQEAAEVIAAVDAGL